MSGEEASAMGEMYVGGQKVEKWHLKPLGVEEGDRARFTFKAPKDDEISEKVGTVTYTPDEDNYAQKKETYAAVDIDDAGEWVLDRGTVQIKQEGRGNRRNGTLIDVEKLPQEGTKVIIEKKAWDKPIVGEVVEVRLRNEVDHLDDDRLRVQREFDPTILPAGFDDVREVK